MIYARNVETRLIVQDHLKSLQLAFENEAVAIPVNGLINESSRDLINFHPLCTLTLAIENLRNSKGESFESDLV